MRPATQGVNPWDVIEAFQRYLYKILELPPRRVQFWWGTSRPHLQGQDLFLWFRLQEDQPSKSVGPGRWGNRTDLHFEVHLVTRSFADESQIDIRRAKEFYMSYWKLEQSFLGLSLFSDYNDPVSTDFGDPIVPASLWNPPLPTAEATILSVEPMYMDSLPAPDKTQKEEGTSEARMLVILPTVLALTVPTTPEA